MTTMVLEAKNLSKSYRLGDEIIRALDDVDLALERGEFVAVMGPSGSGKTTLLHMLGLLDTADEGGISIAGRTIQGLDDDALTRIRCNNLGFVFQTFELIPSLTARENILLPAQAAGNRREAKVRLEKLAEQLGIGNRLEHRPQQLSSGQQQRVAIARALINNPEVILADEPTGNLDSETGHEVLSLLRDGVRRHSWTVLMVTHDPKAAHFADRIIYLEDGRISGMDRLDSEESQA